MVGWCQKYVHHYFLYFCYLPTIITPDYVPLSRLTRHCHCHLFLKIVFIIDAAALTGETRRMDDNKADWQNKY